MGLIVAAGPLLAAGSARAEAPAKRDHLGRALAAGTTHLSLRYRSEWVRDDNASLKDKNGYASTIRTALSYETGAFHHARAFLEFEDVTDIGLEKEHRNAGAGSLSNGVSGRPVVADVAVTEVNQGYLAYSGILGTEVKAGRMELALDDERFVGPVGWRQNHQSFDGAVLTQNSIPRAKLTYAFIRDVNRVFGDRQRMKTHLINLAINAGKAGRLVPYLYRLDYDEASAAALSTLTLGGSWTGEVGGGGFVFPGHLQVARQTGASDNPGEVEAFYVRGELGARRGPAWTRLGMELLDGSAAEGRFSTPLATLHKWNGWADKFLATPADGLEDFYLGAGGRWGGFDAMVVAHEFKAASTSTRYGGEMDAQVSWRAPWKQVLASKLAYYDAAGYSVDTVKLMLWTSYGF